MGEKIRLRVVVHGRVQGVGFRWATTRRAAAHGVSGFVRNLPDGTVEAEVEGDRGPVDRMLDFLRAGPSGASVTSLDVEPVAPRGSTGFDEVP